MNITEQTQAILAHLTRQQQTLCFAESCTGGLLAAQITSVAGASAVFVGALVSYANSVKRDLLAVSDDVLREQGAVSSSCALAMALGARRMMGADWAISTTGVAGPGGGGAEKPVGLVWIAISSAAQEYSESYVFSGNRNQIQTSAVHSALALLHKTLEA